MALTGADIAVSDADPTNIGAALAGKAGASVLSGLYLADGADLSGIADVLREVLRRLGGQVS